MTHYLTHSLSLSLPFIIPSPQSFGLAVEHEKVCSSCLTPTTPSPPSPAPSNPSTLLLHHYPILVDVLLRTQNPLTSLSYSSTRHLMELTNLLVDSFMTSRTDKPCERVGCFGTIERRCGTRPKANEDGQCRNRLETGAGDEGECR